MSALVIVLAVVVLLGLAFLASAVKIVRPYQRGLVERLGRYKTTKEPGFNLIIPFIETMQASSTCASRWWTCPRRR
ncbi:MAG: SPFH domain-containing protein [Acidimicrobiales bacterium]